MSVLTDDLCFEINAQPSLVYPSLPNTYRQQQQQQQSQDSSRQTCIHFASRLIKLRSELRSPSYMRSNYFPPSSSSTITLGRTNSLPNVTKDDEHPYSNHLDCREDESEILSNTTTTDEASQLTYLTELVRRSTAPKPSTKDLLSLPSKQDFVLRQETSKISRRSVSLRDIIYESIRNKEVLAHPVTTDNFSSLALASQLIYASSSESRSKEGEEGKEEEKADEKEKKESVIHHAELTTVTTTTTTTTCCCTCNKNVSPYPTPSLSRETTKSLFSTMSSDSEDEESVYNKKSVVVRRRPTTTAFLVSLSPSSAAAASVAKWRRSNKRQVRTQQNDTTIT
ncbi:hypothetical protein MFLAVUS_004774 [Mucor flavus]|uniref:Uncharacterized protein n=1 Tax=Mucor flavus TaxID=439312 RepID=A0ABP9YWU9_9FUNG